MRISFFDGNRSQNILFLGHVIAILYWLITLTATDSYYIPYLIVGGCGILFSYINIIEKKDLENDSKDNTIIFLFSILFSAMTILANYQIFSGIIVPEYSGSLFSYLYRKIPIAGCFAGGFLAFGNLLYYLKNRLKDYCWQKSERLRWRASYVYFISLTIISTVNIVIMVMCYYPGNISPDSVSVMKQALYGPYSNHHPFYYTKIVEVFLKGGMNWFQDINKAIAFFSTFQIVFMAACISWGIVTLYEMKISLKLIAGCFIWYAVMPFHIMYSFTMWKDVMFGGTVALFVVSVFRIWKKIGNNEYVNYFMLMAGGIGTCLFRSNGLFSFVLMFFCFMILFIDREEKKRMRSLFLGIIIVAFVLKHPVLQFLDVRQPDVLESLSVPIQQIARIIRDCDDVKEEHRELLCKVVDVNQISELYSPHISDPIKKLVRDSGSLQYMIDHKGAYIGLYFEMSLSHLDKSMEAWIDLTKGYWNGGYPYWRWADMVEPENGIGAKRIVHSEDMKHVIDEYLWMYTDNPFLQIFLCIGFHVWIILALAALCIMRRDREGVFLMVLPLSIVVSLLISTPVYSEFRYAYAIFCCIPFLMLAPFYKKDSI